MSNMFERATREKTRFNFRGSITVEDLWDLTLVDLDTIYGKLETELENLPKKSLLSGSSTQREDIEFKQSIIKYIVETKQKEVDEATLAKANATKKEMILNILARKKNESYENMSIEELETLVKDL